MVDFERVGLAIQQRRRYWNLDFSYLTMTQSTGKREVHMVGKGRGVEKWEGWRGGGVIKYSNGISKDLLDAQVRRDRRQAPPILHMAWSPA